MVTNLNSKELLSLMKDFYLLTGIKIVVFDDEYNEVLAYPDSHCAFCRLFKENENYRKKCNDSDKHAFSKCKKTKELNVYHCHAGLVEAISPLVENGAIIGYIMFGQITDITDDKELSDLITKNIQSNSFNITEEQLDSLQQIEKKTTEQIHAAAKILQACAFYTILKKLVSIRNKSFLDELTAYINSHISENLTSDVLADALGISRSKLYEECKKYFNDGIASYIKEKRIEKAKELLSHTNKSVSKIADDCGFADYNYFCRIFKKHTGFPAKTYRQQHNTH